ncbi:MAG: archaemetzincin family Zn-dependent metalloprotease [Candidatus Methanoglobus sp.]|jgi:archaemetzincin
MIQLLPLGAVDKELVAWLAGELRGVFKTEVSVLPTIPIPQDCYSRRGQYNSSCIISKLRVKKRTLAVTSEDLYARGLNFVFGEAELGGLRAVVSYHRLKFGADREKLKERLLKEAVHELGHVFGLTHCKTPGCVMNFSSSVFEVDLKSSRFCKNCVSKIGMSP